MHLEQYTCEGIDFLRTSTAIIRKVLDGERPSRPRGDEGRLFMVGIWMTVQLYWKPQPGDRTNARDVLLTRLEEAPSRLRSPYSVGGDVDKDTYDQSDATLSDPSELSLFVWGLELTFHRPGGITGTSIKGYDDGLLVSPRSPPCNSIMAICWGGSQGGPASRLTRNVRRMFGVVTRKLCGL